MWSRIRHNPLLMSFNKNQNDYSLIEDNLYLGNKDFANNYQELKSMSISLIIAVYPKDFKYNYLRPPNCRLYHIEVNDRIHEDLVSHFDYCYELISEELAQEEGKVLVFCGAGLSRSATIVAAYLMKKYKISAEEALERMRQKRDKINPNVGFMAQLSLYEDMGHKLDLNHNEYRLFILINLKKKIWCKSYWEDSKLSQLNREFCEPMQLYLDKLKHNPNLKPQTHYECKKCDEVLFEEINVIINIDRDKSDDRISEECPNMFIEPNKWMLPSIVRNMSGKLKCPNCSALLGAYKWKSYECDCILHNQLLDSRIFKINAKSIVKIVE